jgi:hypothetical protein
LIDDRKEVIVIRSLGLAIAGTVLAATLGLAAWHGASAENWAGVMLLATCGVLMLSAIGAVCHGSDFRPRLVGFAVFGWGYFALARWYTYHQGPMPTVCWQPGSGDIHNDLLALLPAVRIAHDAWALAFAVLGGILTGFLFKHSSAHKQVHVDEMRASGGPARGWRAPASAGLLSIGLVAVAAVLASGRWMPEIWAGAAFLLTWALTGLAILGAVCARGRRREVWFGAASFGIGYLIVAFSPVLSMALPTDHFLNAVFRPGGPTTRPEPPVDDLITDDESLRVSRALHEPITLHFTERTSLKIVLEHIKNAIRGSLGKDLVLFAGGESRVYPPRELDKNVVTIDRANIPAEDALRLCLGQIGMTYRVQSGYIRIVTDAYQPLPFEEDPVMIAGHSLLALCAAGFGGISALLVAGLLGRHKER